MRPAFSSNKQAAAFVVLLMVLLLSPVLAGKRFLPPREEIYKYQGLGIAPFPWLHRQIFEETNDIDIAFIGSSRLLHGIDTQHVQDKLDQRLGRPSVVRSICWGGSGYDVLYLIAHDLLTRRHVHMLVFYDEDGEQFRNPVVPLLFRWGDDREVLTGLPAREKAVFFLAAIEGLPRNLLAAIRPEILAPEFWHEPNDFEKKFKSEDPAWHLGSAPARRGFNEDYNATTPFEPYRPASQRATNEISIYAESEKGKWEFENLTLPVWQPHFARKFVGLAQKNGCNLVMLHCPRIEEAQSSRIPEREFWPDYLGVNIKMLGIPANRLFDHLTDDEVLKLYFDPRHLNQNGQQFFTSVITPALLQLYETHANP